MSIRQCAMEDPAFRRLYHAYINREEDALNWRASGGKVVAELGCDVPDELIIAAGMFPLRVYAKPHGELVYTDKYLEFSFDPRIRRQFERLVDGSYSGLADMLAISNSTDVIIRVYLYLREIVRSGENLSVPPATFIDWLFTQNFTYQNRNEFVIKLFWKQLEECAGRKITGDEVESAAMLCNRDRMALRKLAELRRGEVCRVNGSEALVIIGSAMFMNRSEHARLTESLCRRAAGWPAVEGRKIFMTGSEQEDLTLYGLVEDAGGVVVAEDHDWGDRYYERDYNTACTPIRAIVDRYMLRSASSKKSFVSQRVEALNRSVDGSGAEAVLFYFNLYEEAASWDYPSQRRSLGARGIPSAHFAKMRYPTEDNAGLGRELANFVESIRR